MLFAPLVAYAQHCQHLKEVVVQHLLRPEEQEQVMLSLQEDRTHQAGLPLQMQSAGSLLQVITIFVSFSSSPFDYAYYYTWTTLGRSIAPSFTLINPT